MLASPTTLPRLAMQLAMTEVSMPDPANQRPSWRLLLEYPARGKVSDGSPCGILVATFGPTSNYSPSVPALFLKGVRKNTPVSNFGEWYARSCYKKRPPSLRTRLALRSGDL